jgi:hypothetical protein
MAELTTLEEKLGEVIGLAMAAQAATDKVRTLAENDGADEQVSLLERMQEEAAEAERRGTKLAATFEGKKTAILEKARETKQKGSKMMSTYLGDDADALDGFEFLTMAEAGEVGHWSVLGTLDEEFGHSGIRDLVTWGLPIQQRHLRDVQAASLQLAAQEEPAEAS